MTRSQKHGLSKHELYPTWIGILRRIDNPDDPGYKNYGGRGISVCDRWRDVTSFITDIETSIGPRPQGLTLERIDNNGNYEPGNVAWASRWEQWHNRRIYCNGKFSVVPPPLPPRVEGNWLPIPGYAGFYEASDAGNVYSLPRAATAGGPLDVQLNPAGYRIVRLSKYGEARTIPVGRLILLTFRGQPPHPGSRARHGPGGKTDDSLPNLHWS